MIEVPATVKSRNGGTKYRTLKRNIEGKKSLKSPGKYTRLEVANGSHQKRSDEGVSPKSFYKTQLTELLRSYANGLKSSKRRLTL
jgi:hypothetical protein